MGCEMKQERGGHTRLLVILLSENMLAGKELSAAAKRGMDEQLGEAMASGGLIQRASNSPAGI